MCVCVSVIGHNLPVSRNISCFFNSTVGNKNVFLWLFLWGSGVGGSVRDGLNFV